MTVNMVAVVDYTGDGNLTNALSDFCTDHAVVTRTFQSITHALDSKLGEDPYTSYAFTNVMPLWGYKDEKLMGQNILALPRLGWGITEHPTDVA